MQLHELCDAGLAPCPGRLPLSLPTGSPMIRSSSHLKHQHASARLSSLDSITSSPQPACRRANARKHSLAPCRSSSLGGAALPTSSCIRSSLSTVPLPGATSVLPPERRGAPPTAHFFSSSRFLDHGRG